MGIAEGAHGESERLHCRSSPSLPSGAGTVEGPTMVFPGPLAVTLLVVHLACSQDVAGEASGEQQLCSLREHPIVAFAGESHFPLGPSLQ